MRADQMRFYDRICKFKIAAFVLHFCTSAWSRNGANAEKNRLNGAEMAQTRVGTEQEQ